MRIKNNIDVWYPWFAWRPVVLENGDWVWLETVYRYHVRNSYYNYSKYKDVPCQ